MHPVGRRAGDVNLDASTVEATAPVKAMDVSWNKNWKDLSRYILGTGIIDLKSGIVNRKL